MNAYQTKAELIEAYAEMLVIDRVAHGQTFAQAEADMDLFRMIATSKTSYAPHISNLGWFIRGFGYSLDRNPGDRVLRLELMAA